MINLTYHDRALGMISERVLRPSILKQNVYITWSGGIKSIHPSLRSTGSDAHLKVQTHGQDLIHNLSLMCHDQMLISINLTDDNEKWVKFRNLDVMSVKRVTESGYWVTGLQISSVTFLLTQTVLNHQPFRAPKALFSSRTQGWVPVYRILTV